ncbi:MAG: right-handed parallel beta-helix repeat-containing protein [candidate division KSB1 bacterium]|nr:right-handed parallel beta-helix repeat-containing protein [candidate division KSB1 bacterium]
MNCTRNLISVEQFNLSGFVDVKGTDDDGVMIELYPLTEPDTTVARMRERFPTVGMELNQATLFDHRDSEPLYTATTDTAGAYRITNIPAGDYNLVARKFGYGWRYIYNVNADTEPQTIPLYAEQHVSGTLDSYTEWPAFQHVIVEDDVTVPEGGTLLINEGVVVRSQRGKGLIVHGQLLAYGSNAAKIWFVADDEEWRGIQINSSKKCDIYHCVMKECDTGFVIDEGQIYVDNFYVKNVLSFGFYLKRLSKFELNRSVLKNSCIKCESNTEGEISNSLIAGEGKSENPAFILNSSKIKLYNNCIFDHSGPIVIQYYSEVELWYNYFLSLEQCIYCEYYSNVIVNKNTFEDFKTDCIVLYKHGYITINNNNFISDHSKRIIWITPSPFDNPHNMNAKYNYWGTIFPSAIYQRIIDERVNENKNEMNWEIIIEPFRDEIIKDAYPTSK